MILSDTKILDEVNKGNIVISPFNKSNLGSNSYDVHLYHKLVCYVDYVLDAKKNNKCYEVTIPEDGFILEPNILYLGSTVEYTETHKHVPFLEGKSSIGRLGIDIHATAGKGDVGFCNHWTLEISVVQPVKVYPLMPIGQLIYFAVDGEVDVPYNAKKTAKYNKLSKDPVPSKYHENYTVNDFFN